MGLVIVLSLNQQQFLSKNDAYFQIQNNTEMSDDLGLCTMCVWCSNTIIA